MVFVDAIPSFPPPSVIERVRSLGYGTGPWPREALVSRWGAPVADKFVSEARAAGWLVSPYRGIWYVPAAQDLMTVGWLPEPQRTEFLASRTLTTAGVPFWCLSAWCRDRGLDLGGPVFVTDLGVGASLPADRATARTDRKALRSAAEAGARRFSPLPFLDSLVIVPIMPSPSSELEVRMAAAPEEPEVEARRQKDQALGRAMLGLAGLVVWGAMKAPPDVGKALGAWAERPTKARGFQYSLGSGLTDEAWILAVLASLGTARCEEFVTGRLRTPGALAPAALQRWAGLMGPPQPVAGWREAILEGPFPFLLVPPVLWAQMGPDQAARRFRMLERVGEA